MKVKKICCLGIGQVGVPLSVAIATKCPEIRVTLVHMNAEDVFRLNTNKIPGAVSVPGLEEMIRKCHNKNLFFTNNEKVSIREADMIFIMTHSKLKTLGEEKDQTVDLSQVEDAATLIAKYADTDKIVVENSAIPLRTSECIKSTLVFNCLRGVKFEVLSNPEFYEEGSPIQDLLHPDWVLIGSELTPSGTAAAKELMAIYERWVPTKNIFMQENWALELAKLSIDAIAAQRMTNAYTLAAICEEADKDILEIAGILSFDSKFALGYLHANLGSSRMINSVINMVYLCESLNLQLVADFWRQILVINNFHKNRFYNRLVYSLNQTSWNRKISILGFAYYKNTTVTEGSSALDLCKYLLKENATISIYDPKITKEQVLDDLKAIGCGNFVESLETVVSITNDPYLAVAKTQVVIVCKTWKEFKALDYDKIFQDMVKPAYLYDCGNFLQHDQLLKLGFKVFTIGKQIQNT